MNERTPDTTARAPGAANHRPSTARDATRGLGRVWETPRVEVISLSCEISAYAPDEDGWPPF
jgi:hypothetical protein